MSDNSIDLTFSRDEEREIYMQTIKACYEDEMAEILPLFWKTAELTKNFTDIRGEVILSQPRILSILRYCVSPTISQMKMGQLVGMNSTDVLEKKSKSDRKMVEKYGGAAFEIAAFIRNSLDPLRFPWVQSNYSTRPSIDQIQNCANWTCSLVAGQRAETAYRSTRKNLQEAKIHDFFMENGFKRATPISLLVSPEQLPSHSFLTETTIQARTKQKADVIFRTKSGKIGFVEAKAVGVLLDSTKRIKECCDKASDWASFPSQEKQSFAFIGGYFNQSGIDKLHASDIVVIWEHRPSDLHKYLS